ncbi:uncharacterized protein LOC115389494 [Salarias fasciatus]|uniref:uncharacterized protein LOC115389494 n=1 Tax=Salarias fasciatus TaxID=181472 RepID=UPI0011767675|nr:uncharacterized protein LOC115389494 [Salarias fasciatus]
MAGFCWRAAAVALVLSAGASLAAVNQNQLGNIVSDILNRYRPSYELPWGSRSFPMFSLAVSIPHNDIQKMYDVSKVTDCSARVKEEVLKCNVYTSDRMVAATVLRWPNVLRQCPNERVQWRDVLDKCPAGVKTWTDVQQRCPSAVTDGTADHAEYRTVQSLHALLKKHNKDDLLIFYVLASPCLNRCADETNHRSILKHIIQIQKWKNYAFVFSDVFSPRSGQVIPEEDLRRALWQLGTYKGPLGSIGLNNIFRCTKQSADSSKVTCRNCSQNNLVARDCFSK